MAITTKNGSKNKKAKLRRPVVKTSPAKQAQTIAELRQQLAESLQREEAALKDLQDRDQQLAESLRRESATGGENVHLSKELQDCRRQLTDSLDSGAWYPSHPRRPRAKRFPHAGFRHRLAHLRICSTSSEGGTHWVTGRTLHRGAPLYSDADQAARDLRRPGGDRDRERAALQRTQGSIGTADGDE